MTKGRTIWLALLAVGLVVALLLRTPRPEAPSSNPEASAAPPSSARGAASETDEFEIEVADPHEVGIAPRPAPAAPSAPATDEELNRVLARSWESEPARALALAEDGEKRFGESPRAVERRFYEIKALVKLGRIGSARTRAERYLAAHPPGPMTDEIERLTGVHRRTE